MSVTKFYIHKNCHKKKQFPDMEQDNIYIYTDMYYFLQMVNKPMMCLSTSTILTDNLKDFIAQKTLHFMDSPSFPIFLSIQL